MRNTLRGGKSGGLHDGLPREDVGRMSEFIVMFSSAAASLQLKSNEKIQHFGICVGKSAVHFDYRWDWCRHMHARPGVS